MSITKDVPLPESFLHQKDVRPPKEIILSKELSRSLSQLNLNRVHSHRDIIKSYNFTNNFYFICLTGIPPIKDEFEDLDLQGEKIVYTTAGMKETQTEKESLELINKTDFDTEADNLHKIIESIDKKYKIVVIYHSFGTYIFANYVHRHPIESNRLKGIIDMGGVTITMYPEIKNILSMLLKTNMEFLLTNSDFVYEQYLKQTTRSANFITFSNKYQLILFFKFCLSNTFPLLFDHIRNLPKVLKLFVAGRRDPIFPESLLSEKLIYYCYINKLPEKNTKNLIEIYKESYKKSIENIQERFIYNIEKGKHSLHKQESVRNEIRLIVKEYLKILDQSISKN